MSAPIQPPGEHRTASLHVEGLRVRYPGRREPALDAIDLAVQGGELVAVAGRTGAGKSTLTLAASGFIPRVVHARLEGSVRIGGVAIGGATAGELAGGVGIVFSTPSNQLSASKLTVREELAFGLENLGVPRPEMDARIDAVLERLGIAHLADREPFALSGGEQQRVAIASIVAMGTDVIVLDEPTAQLDPAGTRGVAALLRDLASEGAAVLCAEHASPVLGSADRCLVLDDGRAMALDRPGAALGSSILGPLGLRPPSIVRLAELAGVPAELAFAEEAIVSRLSASWLTEAADRLDGPFASPAREDVAWVPVRDQPPAAIQVRGVSHRYPGGVQAVHGVDLDLAPGETVAIVGQNGSGKTTLVKHLNRLLLPDAGVVHIAGRDIAGEPVHVLARTVGLVFQNPDDQLFNRSVEREVAFGPRNLGLPASDVKRLVEQALLVTGLTGERSVNPYDLGPSHRKLVALASVLSMDPAVLVLDEPTTGQDGPGVERVGAIVDAFAAAGRTVIAITHDMEFAATHFRRIVVMRAGQIVAEGSPSDVFAEPNWAILASTYLEPPLAARIGARLGIGSTPTGADLVEGLRSRGARDA